MKARWVFHVSLAALCLAAAGCKPTYRAGTALSAIEDLCEKEYGVRVAVQTNGKTIGVMIPTSGVLKSDLSFSDHVLDKIDHVMLTVTRVTLSSEMKYDFFVVATRDLRTGAQITFVRYIKDVRRLITDDISRTDFFQRMIIDAEVVDPKIPFQLKAYRFEDFLAEQLAERMRSDLEQNAVASRLFQLEGVDGAFIQGAPGDPGASASKFFRLTLLFHPGAAPFETMGSPTLRDDFVRMFLHTAQTVTRRYEFHDFDGLELADSDGRRLAYFDRKEFTRDTVNTLMELIRSLKDKNAK